MLTSSAYDVFVSHNGRDKPVVERLCWALLEAGLRPWFDKWDLAPGDAWIAEVERILDQVPAVLVCLGSHGLSVWHDAERQAAMDRAAKGRGVVVPVLLPDAPELVELPVFLRGRQAVDLRTESAWDAGVARLAAAIVGGEPRLPPWVDDGRERPYPGLQAFTEGDAGWMFGRDREREQLLDTLRAGQRFITVVGASGSGKSSLVRAGVVPAVRTGSVDGRRRWHALVMRPGSRPCHALAVRLMELRRRIEGADVDIVGDSDYLDDLAARLVASDSKLSSVADVLLDRDEHDEQLLVVVDQLEELFTEPVGRGSGAGAPPDHVTMPSSVAPTLAPEGEAFLRNLLHATAIEGGRVHVILTVRADFLGECLAIRELARCMERMSLALPPMEVEQLREAIRRPALRVGYDVEQALVDVLVAATVDQPGRLPLLQYTLEQLWEARDRSQRRLTYAAYTEQVGSVEESVARRAEDVFEALGKRGEANEAVVRRVFVRLVHLGEGTRDSRRQVPRSDLSSDAAAGVVLDAFIAARLLVTDTHRRTAGGQPEQIVEIAHEALLGRWNRLRRWLDENREALRIRQALDLAEEHWGRQGHPADELWRGGRLARAWEALVEGQVDLLECERAFLVASKAAEEEELRAKQEAKQAELKRQFQRWLLVCVTSATLVLLGALVFSIAQRRRAEHLAAANAELAEQAEVASRREQATLASLLVRVPGRELEALELAVRASRVSDDEDPHVDEQVARSLHDALTHARTVAVLDESATIAGPLAWKPDGTRLATAGFGGAVSLWDGTTGDALAKWEGHDAAVAALAWRSDGTRLATADVWGTIGLWDGETSVPSTMFEGHDAAVMALAWRPDGSRLATASWDRTAGLWNGETGEPLATLQGHSGPVVALAWAPDGGRLATASFDGTARLWDGETGEPLATLRGHRKGVVALAWAPDGGRLATASSDGTAGLWDGTTGELLVTLGHTKEVEAVAWAADGTRLATASLDGKARLWDGKTGEPLATLEGHTKGIAALSWTSDGTRLATAGLDGTLRLWDGDAGEPLARLQYHTKRPVRETPHARFDFEPRRRGLKKKFLDTGSDKRRKVVVAWKPDGTRLATASFDGTVKVWDGTTAAPSAALWGHSKEVVAVAWTADGTRVATASFDGTARVWDGGTGEPLIVLDGHAAEVAAVAWAPDDTRLATASFDGTARIWDGRTGELLATLADHLGPVAAVAWTADGTRLATASEDRTARVWNGETGDLLVTLKGHDDVVRELAWTADGTRLATASLDDTARVWDGETGEPLVTLRGHEDVVRELAWTADGTRLATASLDGTARVWDGRTGEPLATLKGHEGPVLAVAWTADGTRLATASVDLTARVWDGTTGAPLARLVGHEDTVWALAWAADGKRLVTASLDGTARLWSGETAEALATLEGHAGPVVAVAWTADGTHLATASWDGTARVWLGSPRAWLERACAILEASRGSIARQASTEAICAALAER